MQALWPGNRITYSLFELCVNDLEKSQDDFDLSLAFSTSPFQNTDPTLHHLSLFSNSVFSCLGACQASQLLQLLLLLRIATPNKTVHIASDLCIESACGLLGRQLLRDVALQRGPLSVNALGSMILQTTLARFARELHADMTDLQTFASQRLAVAGPGFVAVCIDGSIGKGSFQEFASTNVTEGFGRRTATGTGQSVRQLSNEETTMLTTFQGTGPAPKTQQVLLPLARMRTTPLSNFLSKIPRVGFETQTKCKDVVKGKSARSTR